jgi:hypothetical protein
MQLSAWKSLPYDFLNPAILTMIGEPMSAICSDIALARQSRCTGHGLVHDPDSPGCRTIARLGHQGPMREAQFFPVRVCLGALKDDLDIVLARYRPRYFLQ